MVKAWRDVWSRSGWGHRVKALMLLGVNVGLFSLVACFAHWIRSGVFFAPGTPEYWRGLAHTFDVSGGTGVTLAGYLAGALSVEQTPALVVVIGLLMAALVSIPLLISVLYRFPASLPFLAAISFLAVMPWLGLTLLLSCLLTALPVRPASRFVTCLVGLLPVSLYLLLASRGAEGPVGSSAEPLAQINYLTPWIVMLVAASLIMAVVLVIARLVDYRPGAIAAMMPLLLALPVALFEFEVGRDEVYFRIIERDYENLYRQRHEEDVFSTDLVRYAEDTWWSLPAPRPDFRDWYARQRLRLGFGLSSLPASMELQRNLITASQQRTVRMCDDFILYYPDSRYAAYVLYIQARVLSLRMDHAAFLETGWVRFNDSIPSSSSWRPYRRIVENFGDSPMAAVALLNLARLDARDGQIASALTYLTRLLDRFDPEKPPATGASGEEVAFSLQGGETAPAVKRQIATPPLEGILREGHRLQDLITRNRDPVHDYAPLCGSTRQGTGFPFGLLDLLPYSPLYEQNLERLKEEYPNSRIVDNIDLELTRLKKSPEERAAALERLIASCDAESCDALPEALLEWADILLAMNRRPEAREALLRVDREFGDTLWGRMARRKLAAPVTLSSE